MDNQVQNEAQQIDQERQQELQTVSPIRMALQNTVLGMFLETRERRYLLAFISYAIAFVLFACVIIFVVQAFMSGAIIHDNNHTFFGKLFTMTCWISGCVALGTFSARRYAMSFQATLVMVFVIFVTVVRP